jgi:hypothetical protein
MAIAIKVAFSKPGCSGDYCGLQSVDRNAFLAIARNASNCCDRRAKLVTMPRQRAIAGVYEAVGANYVSGNVSES